MAGQPQSGNRRLYYRQPMYARIDLRVSGIRVPIPATLIDVSGGGCQIHARTMLKRQQLVDFELPRAGEAALRLNGTIKKVAYAPQDRTFRYSVEFDELAEQSRDELLRFIADEQRRAISSAKAEIDTPVAPLRKRLVRLQELRSAYRVEVNVPVQYSVGDAMTVHDGTATDVSTGGMRLILDQVLRQEWIVTARFTLPNDALKAFAQLRTSGERMRPFSEMRLQARPLPGVRQLRGRYVQSLAFLNPDATVTEDIARFVQIAKLIALGRQ